jgi:hypothetical protein
LTGKAESVDGLRLPQFTAVTNTAINQRLEHIDVGNLVAQLAVQRLRAGVVAENV